MKFKKAGLGKYWTKLSVLYMQLILKKIPMFIKPRNSWVAKSLMSHTFFVKFPGFKHASQENYLTYRLHIFTQS